MRPAVCDATSLVRSRFLCFPLYHDEPMVCTGSVDVSIDKECATRSVSITVTGTIGLDTIITPFGKVDEILGGSGSYFALAASFFQPVSLVAVAGNDLPAHALDPLRERGVALDGVETADGPTFRWGGRYHMDFNTRDTLFTELGVLATFQPKIPPSANGADVVFVANLQPEVQRQVIEALPSARLRALDTMNFWIANTREELTQTLRLADMVIMAEDEVRQFAGVANLRAAARVIFDLGPRHIVIKLGSYGALMLDADGHYFAAPAFPLDDVRDPTGAGDAFAGGFLGYLAERMSGGRELQWADYQRGLLYGNIMGAFACEAFGVERFTMLASDDVEARYHQLIAYSHIIDAAASSDTQE
jgi:sugar/nucleoside kinase (ribokinase family)